MTMLIPFPNRIAAPRADAAYDILAPAYDALTAGIDHEARLDAVETIACRHGLAGRRGLDVAGGTGRSFVPLLGRRYAVVACDSSGEMLRRAARKAPQTPVLVADVRTLPELGRYDLVTCLGGALNCLLHPDDVRAALRAVARSLVRAGRRGGLGGPPARADPLVVSRATGWPTAASGSSPGTGRSRARPGRARSSRRA